MDFNKPEFWLKGTSSAQGIISIDGIKYRLILNEEEEAFILPNKNTLAYYISNMQFQLKFQYSVLSTITQYNIGDSLCVALKMSQGEYKKFLGRREPSKEAAEKEMVETMINNFAQY